VHADRSELVDWLASAPRPPRQIVAVHGDPEALDGLTDAVMRRLGGRVHVPGQGESFLV
jgi:metallo-beta-lactamase family protein